MSHWISNCYVSWGTRRNLGMFWARWLFFRVHLEFETFLVHFVIEMDFTAVVVLISNSVCRNCGARLLHLNFPASLSFMCQLFNQQIEGFDLCTFQWKVHHQVLLLVNAYINFWLSNVGIFLVSFRLHLIYTLLRLGSSLLMCLKNVWYWYKGHIEFPCSIYCAGEFWHLISACRKRWCTYSQWRCFQWNNPKSGRTKIKWHDVYT